MTWDLFNSVAGSRYWVAAGWTMLHFLWVGLAMCALALVLRRLLDRAAPQVRYAVVVACFAGLAIAPLPLYRWTLSRTAEPVHSIGADEGNQRWSSRPSDPSGPTVIHIAPAAQPPLAARVESALHRLVPWMPLIWAVGVPFTLTLLAGGLVGAQNLRSRAIPLTDVDLTRRFARLRTLLFS